MARWGGQQLRAGHQETQRLLCWEASHAVPPTKGRKAWLIVLHSDLPRDKCPSVNYTGKGGGGGAPGDYCWGRSTNGGPAKDESLQWVSCSELDNMATANYFRPLGNQHVFIMVAASGGLVIPGQLLISKINGEARFV